MTDLRAFFLMIALAVTSTAAHAQSTLLQSGAISAGHVPMYVNSYSQQPIVQDSGPASGGGPGIGLSELGLTVRGYGTPPYANGGTGNMGTNFCDYDAPITNSTGYHSLCFSPNAQGGALIAYNAFGSAPQLPLSVEVNGVTEAFPFGTTSPPSYVQTIAALEASTTSTLPVTQITVVSYSNTGDGGGGTFSVGTATTANGCTIFNDASGRSWYRSYSGAINIEWCGADYTGTNDSTAAIQSAFNDGKAVFVPAGTFKDSGAQMPATPYFTLFGTGPSSILMQTGANAINWNQSSVAYNNQTIRNLGFNGTNGTNNTIDTTGAGGPTFTGLYFYNVPAGYSSIYVNGVGATYTHDTRMSGIQIYSNTGGYAGIRLGATSSDQSISDFIMNGGFDVDYGIEMDSGADTLNVVDSHPYNAKINVVYLAGSNSNTTFANDTFDNSLQDIVSVNGDSSVSFTGGFIEAVPSGYSGILVNNTSNTTITGVQFQSSVGALAAVRETGSSNDTIIRSGNPGTISDYVDGPFALIGSQSTASSTQGIILWADAFILVVPQHLPKLKILQNI